MPSFERGVDAQRMRSWQAQPRQSDAADAESAHEGREQNAQRNGCGPERQLQHLIPGDLIDQRRAAAADEENEQKRKISGKADRGVFRGCGCRACG